MTNLSADSMSGPLHLAVKSDGTAVDAIDIVNVTVASSINAVPVARLVINDGDAATQDYPLSESDTFKPGAEIVIKAGYGVANQQIFRGVVVRHRLRINSGGCQLFVECRDRAYAMTLDRKNAHYGDRADSDVLRALIENYSGLKAKVSAIDTKPGKQVQYDASDWDYMLMRAEANGMVVIAKDGVVTVAPPDTSATAALELVIGDDIFQFDADIDSRTQLQSVEAAAWDIEHQKMKRATAEPIALNKQGNWSGSVLAKAAGAETFRIQTSASVDNEALESWAKSRQLKAGLARIQGSVSFQGSERATVGCTIKISGVGRRFDGDLYVSGVKHEISQGNWSTHVEFGLSPEWFVEKHPATSPSAGGLLPAISGLHVGVVKQLDQDPAMQHRIQVCIPAMGEEAEPVWARLASGYASNGFGSFCIPEINDEVVLGFMNDNPSQPVILGSLYSSGRAPAESYTFDADNNLKALVTRSHLKVEFDDDKKIVTVETPAGNSVVLNDDDKSVTLKDENASTVVMNADGISMHSSKNLELSAQGRVTISASAVDLSATSDVSVEGANINHSAKIGFSAKGSASAELSAEGNTTVKGAMVMIN